MRSLFVSLFVLASFFAGAQNTASSGWTFFKAEKGIKIYYQYVDCDFNIGPDAQYVLLKFENTTGTTVYFEYDQNLWYNGNCATCGSDPNGEFRKQVKVPANGSIEGQCDEVGDAALRIFVKFNAFTTPDLLTRFEFDNIVVTPVTE